MPESEAFIEHLLTPFKALKVSNAYFHLANAVFFSCPATACRHAVEFG